MSGSYNTQTPSSSSKPIRTAQLLAQDDLDRDIAAAHAALDTVHATGAEGLQKWAESEHDADGIIEKLEVVPRGLRGEIRVLEDEARELKTKIADVEKAKSKVEEENSDLKSRPGYKEADRVSRQY